MQRKNNILTPYKSSRNGIAMIMAIMIIVIIGTIMALSISMTALTTKSTNDLYLYEQSELLSKSATEYALLRISEDNNDTDPCHYTGGNFFQDSIYHVTIAVQYIYLAGVCTTQYATVTTDEQNGSILIDISVDVNDTVTSEPIRYFRRTLQKL